MQEEEDFKHGEDEKNHNVNDENNSDDDNKNDDDDNDKDDDDNDDAKMTLKDSISDFKVTHSTAKRAKTNPVIQMGQHQSFLTENLDYEVDSSVRILFM